MLCYIRFEEYCKPLIKQIIWEERQAIMSDNLLCLKVIDWVNKAHKQADHEAQEEKLTAHLLGLWHIGCYEILSFYLIQNTKNIFYYKVLEYTAFRQYYQLR